MARIRTIKPIHWSDKELPNISLQAHLFWIASWNFSDDKGVFENDPLFLKSQIFPRRTDVTVEEIKDWCSQLIKARFIIPIDYEGVDYYVSRTFESHQRIDKPQPSKIPSEIITKLISDRSKTVPRTVSPVLESSSKGIGKERKRKIAPSGAGIVPMPDIQKVKFEDAKKTKAGLVDFIRNEKPAAIEPYFFLWNLFAKKYSLAEVQKISDSRKRKFNVRMNEEGFDFVKVLEKAATSSFLKEGSWFSFDWILENDKNWLKVLEGNYDKGVVQTGKQKPTHTTTVTKLDQLKIDVRYLCDRYREKDFDERIVDPEIYDRMVSASMMQLGTMSKFKADTIEKQKVLAVLDYIKQKTK